MLFDSRYNMCLSHIESTAFLSGEVNILSVDCPEQEVIGLASGLVTKVKP